MIEIIVISLLIAAIYIIYRWTHALRQKPIFPDAPNYNTAGFGMRCSDEIVEQSLNTPFSYINPSCSFGLVCNDGKCLKDIGQPCTTIFECLPGTLVCDGVCSLDYRS